MYITTEPYSFEGYWAFSKDQSCWFPGVLEYSPESHKIELRMWGSGEEVNLDYKTDTIIGRTTDNKKITLLNCIIRRSSWINIENSVISGETFRSIVEASRMLFGRHYNNTNEISYSSLNIRYSDQFDFIQKDGFQHDYSQKKILISYKEPDEIVLIKNDTVEIKICFYGVPDRLRQPSNVSSIVQREYFNITFSEIHNLHFLSNEINILKYFITFSINKNIFPLECSFGEKIDGDETRHTNIDLLDSSFFKTKSKYGAYHRHHNIIEIDDFYDIPDLYEKWRLLFNEKESAIYKFFPTIYDDGNFLDERFHKLVMAFEDYHRNSPEFCQIIVTQNGRNRTVYLKERIDSVFEKFKKHLFYLFKDLHEQGRVIKLIKDTRDFLTHGGNVRKETSVKDPTSYFDLSDLLISIITLMILNDLGFSEDAIKDKIWHLPSYCDLVDNDWSAVQ